MQHLSVNKRMKLWRRTRSLILRRVRMCIGLLDPPHFLLQIDTTRVPAENTTIAKKTTFNGIYPSKYLIDLCSFHWNKSSKKLNENIAWCLNIKLENPLNIFNFSKFHQNSRTFLEMSFFPANFNEFPKKLEQWIDTLEI